MDSGSTKSIVLIMQGMRPASKQGTLSFKAPMMLQGKIRKLQPIIIYDGVEQRVVMPELGEFKNTTTGAHYLVYDATDHPTITSRTALRAKADLRFGDTLALPPLSEVQREASLPAIAACVMYIDGNDVTGSLAVIDAQRSIHTFLTKGIVDERCVVAGVCIGNCNNAFARQLADSFTAEDIRKYSNPEMQRVLKAVYPTDENECMERFVFILESYLDDVLPKELSLFEYARPQFKFYGGVYVCPTS